ncbi:hypothetical protein WDU94_000131 [Cyamophila willieti]
MQRLTTLFLGCMMGVCQIGDIVGDAISLETPSKEHLDHFKIQEAIRQEIDSDECRFDNYTWDRVIAERKQELRWEKRVSAYKAGLITTGLNVDENEMKTHWTDRYSGFWFPHNFRRRRRSAVSDLMDRYREQELLLNADQGRRQRDVGGLNMPVAESDILKPRAEVGGPKCRYVVKQGHDRPRRSLEDIDIMNHRQGSDMSAQHRRLMAKLRRKLLSRRKRYLYDGGKEFNDHLAFQAKDYNYYDYDNMLTAVPLPSSTIKFVEEIKRKKQDVKQGADVHAHNLKHKEVYGGFHNDSELLTFLRNYHHKNFTHEERKQAWYDDYMKDRVDTNVEYFKKNLVNYKTLYKSFREKRNREKPHLCVNPDTEDQSAIVPHFEEHHVMNYSQLYRYFQAACDHAEEKSSEIEPTPENHYMPANHTSSPESLRRTYWSGESEAFVSDYDNERFNTSGWTRSKKRKRAVGPRVYGRINIQVYDGYASDKRRGEKTDEMERSQTNCRRNKVEDETVDNVVSGPNNGERQNDKINDGRQKLDKKGNKEYHRSINEIVRRNGGNIDVREKVEIDSVGDKHKEHVKRIDIRFQINQDNGVSDDTRDTQESESVKPNSLKARHSGRKFNVLNEILELINGNVNVNLINNILSKVLDGQRTKQSNNGMNVILNLVENLMSNNREAVEKPFKGFEIYETQLDKHNEPKEKRQSRSKRSVNERKVLTISKIIKTVQANDEFSLHLILEPTLESVAFQHHNQPKAMRFKRNALHATKKAPAEEDNEEEEEPTDPNDCPLMKRVFYWKKVREANKDVVMSHEKSMEALSMNDYYKRRDREALGITTKEELEAFKEDQERDRKRKEEEKLAEERMLAEAAKHTQSAEEATNDPDGCPLMDKVFYWKQVREANKDVVMSNQAGIDAASKEMDDWEKRRERQSKRIFLPGEYIPEYKEMIKGRRVDPKKGETLDRKKREFPQEESETYEPFEAAMSHEAPNQCGLTFKTPNAAKISTEAPLNEYYMDADEAGKHSEEGVIGCAFTLRPPGAAKKEAEASVQKYEPFEASKNSENAPNACALTFRPPGAGGKIWPDASFPDFAETYEPFEAALKDDEDPEWAITNDPRPTFGGFRNTIDGRRLVTLGPVVKDNTETVFMWSPEETTRRNNSNLGKTLPKVYKGYWTPYKYRGVPSGYKIPVSPYVLNNQNTRRELEHTFPPREHNAISGFVEPKFVRIIYHGTGWTRHVHFMSNWDKKKKDGWKKIMNVSNIYLENYKQVEDIALRTEILNSCKLPSKIQNLYVDPLTNRSRFTNHYYDHEGDLIYVTDNRRRVPKDNSSLLTYKFNFRYYFPRSTKTTIMHLKEPLVVQLHYDFGNLSNEKGLSEPVGNVRGK